MDLVDDGIPGKYRDFRSASGPQMDHPNNRKARNYKEKRPLNNRLTTSPENYPKCTENAVYHFQSFAENASIDGIKFVGEKGRSIFERIFWAIILLTSLVLCIMLVLQTFNKWINSPVIVTFATAETPIFEIPFPAITVCPEVKTDKWKFNYTDVYLKKENNETLDDFEELAFKHISLICNSPTELLEKNATVTDKDAIRFLTDVAPDFDLTIVGVEWRGRDIDDNKTGFFTPILTSEGICYTFNILDRSEIFTDVVSYYKNFFSANGTKSEWSLEKGYSEDADIDSYPRRTLIAGAKGGLSLTLAAHSQDLDYICGDSLQGFKVTLHHPGEIPRVKQNYFRIPLEQSVVAAIKPNMMTTSGDLISYKPQDRKCYFVSEKNLKFFKVYNQQNCLIECLTNFTLKSCGCVSFNLPSEDDTPMCGSMSKECAEKAKVLFLASEVNYKIKHSKNSKLTRKELNIKNMNYTDNCDCLPSCNSLQYDVETSQSEWDWQKTFDVLRQTKEWDENLDILLGREGLRLSRLTIFFKEMQFITSERNELYGYTDFWANIGGIIGLFTGFSFITMFEIFYYLSLRIFCNVKLFGRHYWSGDPELIEDVQINSDRNKNI